MTSNVPAHPQGRPRTRRYSGTYEVLGDIELPPEQEAEARRQIDQAESERVDVTVTFRWGRQQLDVVRRAAQVVGIPYQTYLKEAVMRRAIDDLRSAREAGVITGNAAAPAGDEATVLVIEPPRHLHER